MLLSIEGHSPLSEDVLSFLLHKHPERLHSQNTSFGQAHLFYPHRQQAVLMLEIDPLKLTRRGGNSSFALQPYVNDRAYVASSFLSVALNQLCRTAMTARCEHHPTWVEQPLELRFHLPVLPCRGGETLLRRLFEPLAYQVEAQQLPLDPEFPDWGNSAYFDVVLQTKQPLYKTLRHLYVMMPVLDNDKHYWVGPDEVDKLLTRGENWLAEHPEKDLIVKRYLKFRKELAGRAISELTPLHEASQEDLGEETPEELVERRIGLHDQRLNAVAARLEVEGVRNVADLGCGEGRLLRRLISNPTLHRILACDVSPIALERAAASLERFPERRREAIELFQSSLMYADQRLSGLDAIVLVEVIEHIEPERLPQVCKNLFYHARPKLLLITTPNADYNAVWESLPAGRFRHQDHRFEWTREQFRQWCDKVRGDYTVEIQGLGPEHETLGHPSQMAVFRR